MRKRPSTTKKRAYTARERARLMIPLALGFMVVIPLLISNAYRLDQLLGLPAIPASLVIKILAGILGLAGLALAFWTITLQWTIGKGTPAPMMPTQKLIVSGPFKFVRNPMALGTIIAYLALAVIAGSISAIILIILVAGMLLAYIRKKEEAELLLRFGQPYAEYRQRVPFLIPKFSKPSNKMN